MPGRILFAFTMIVFGAQHFFKPEIYREHCSSTRRAWGKSTITRAASVAICIGVRDVALGRVQFGTACLSSRFDRRRQVDGDLWIETSSSCSM
jgi:hypothetical protein